MGWGHREAGPGSTSAGGAGPQDSEVGGGGRGCWGRAHAPKARQRAGPGPTGPAANPTLRARKGQAFPASPVVTTWMLLASIRFLQKFCWCPFRGRVPTQGRARHPKSRGHWGRRGGPGRRHGGPSGSHRSCPAASQPPRPALPAALSGLTVPLVWMTHYVVCSGAGLRFPEGKQQTKPNTPNAFSPCSAEPAEVPRRHTAEVGTIRPQQGGGDRGGGRGGEPTASSSSPFTLLSF